jgi:hypothetical protein
MTKAEKAQRRKMKESFDSTTTGRVVSLSLLDDMEEYEKNPQMGEILAVLVRMVHEHDLDRPVVADVLDVLRVEYLEYHATEHVSPSAKFLYGNPNLDDAFRLKAEEYIWLIIRTIEKFANVPPARRAK